MSQNLFTYRIQTSGKQSLTNIDVYLEDALTKSGVKDGILVVFCPHTTAAITINERRQLRRPHQILSDGCQRNDHCDGRTDAVGDLAKHLFLGL